MNNRKRIFSLLKYLIAYTDDNHRIGTGELTKIICGEDSPAKRKTIKSDLKYLSEFEDVDIVVKKGNPDELCIGTRVFDVAEVKFLVDAVSSSGILTKNMKKKLVEKLSKFVSIYQAEKLKSHLYIPEHLKNNNVQFFYTIDKITDAMDRQNKISFSYLTYDTNKLMTEKKHADGSVKKYICSPYCLVLENGRYYLLGYSDVRQKEAVFRIDRIVDLIILDDPAVNIDIEFDTEKYLKGTFKMYGGEPLSVKFECEKSMINTVIDHFGTEINISSISDEKFVFETEVKTSPTFYGWIFQANGKISILEPQKAIDEYNKMLIANLKSIHAAGNGI